jgi:hypothetical protein
MKERRRLYWWLLFHGWLGIPWVKALARVVRGPYAR